MSKVHGICYNIQTVNKTIRGARQKRRGSRYLQQAICCYISCIFKMMTAFFYNGMSSFVVCHPKKM